MQGIESKQYKDIVKAVEKFEELIPLYGTVLPDGYENIIRKKAIELKGTYDYYQILLKELEDCISSYGDTHQSLRKMVYPCVRKMNTKYKNKL